MTSDRRRIILETFSEHNEDVSTHRYLQLLGHLQKFGYDPTKINEDLADMDINHEGLFNFEFLIDNMGIGQPGLTGVTTWLTAAGENALGALRNPQAVFQSPVTEDNSDLTNSLNQLRGLKNQFATENEKAELELLVNTLSTLITGQIRPESAVLNVANHFLDQNWELVGAAATPLLVVLGKQSLKGL